MLWARGPSGPLAVLTAGKYLIPEAPPAADLAGVHPTAPPTLHEADRVAGIHRVVELCIAGLHLIGPMGIGVAGITRVFLSCTLSSPFFMSIRKDEEREPKKFIS